MGAEHLMDEAVRGADVDARAAVDRAARDSRTRLVALLAAASGDVALAEDAVATAFQAALTRWPSTGVPRNPEGWLLTVARNHQRDTWRSAAYRRTASLDVGGPEVLTASVLDGTDPEAIPDRRLALLFVLAHPAIHEGARAPLILQVVLGFDAARIATAFAVEPGTMAKRLVRAKRRIREARIPFVVPDRSGMSERLPAVLEAIYGCFAIAWRDADGTGPRVPGSMAGEALHLATTLATLLEDEPEAWGLASCIALSLSRATTRTGPYLPIEDQDPASWDEGLMSQGEELLRRASAHGQPGRFQLEAAMQAVHAERRYTGEVDWEALLTLSSALLLVSSSIGAQVAHAAILGRASSAQDGLAALEAIEWSSGPLDRFQPFHATRAALLARMGRHREASAAFDRAAALTDDERMSAWLLQRASDERARP